MIGYRDARQVVICDGCQKVHYFKPGSMQERDLQYGIPQVKIEGRDVTSHHACNAECAADIKVTRYAPDIDLTKPVVPARFRQ